MIESIGNSCLVVQIFYFEEKVKVVAFPWHFRCCSFSLEFCLPFLLGGAVLVLSG